MNAKGEIKMDDDWTVGTGLRRILIKREEPITRLHGEALLKVSGFEQDEITDDLINAAVSFIGKKKIDMEIRRKAAREEAKTPEGVAYRKQVQEEDRQAARNAILTELAAIQ